MAHGGAGITRMDGNLKERHMDKHALLDLIELLDEERRLNETLAFYRGMPSTRSGTRWRHAATPRRSPTSAGNWHRNVAPGAACPPPAVSSMPTSTRCSTAVSNRRAHRQTAACSMAVFRPRSDARGGDGHLRDHPTIARAAPIRANLSGSTAWR